MLAADHKAPDFELPDQNGEKVKLSDFKRQWVVLYFYHKDMTPGCTTEACNFQEALHDFQNLKAVVLGVSKDSVERHKKFAEKYNLRFRLLSDAENNVCETYGVWGEKSMYGRKYMGINRSTFLIDPQGKIAKVYPKVKVKKHHQEVKEDLKTLQAAAQSE
ncbi:MAG TPA: thioredoxin-dependent thiol peroxidase [Caldithrix abyssi]|uniref:thioredoxin-dependent peroxiredoxin n=1 Tax=Caldithrix abyssi TaxID=187145 RepID=A0A7V5H418_CALAY|nr:thioredoxin-dependent thiol peroxidase [Caldithrix abyssi]